MSVEGEIQYSTETHKKQKIKFEFDMRFGFGGSAGMPPMGRDSKIDLKAGELRDRYLSIDRKIEPGEADHFLIKIGSDKSAQYVLSFSFRELGGKIIPGDNKVKLDIFVPRKVYPFFD